MERATTSFPTPVSPRISTFALLRAAMLMLRRKAIVVSLLPSSTADPRTDFPIDRIVFASGGVAERTDALNGAFVRAHHIRFEMSMIVHAKKRDLTGGGHLASRCECRGSGSRRYKSGITEGRPGYSRVVPGGYGLSTSAQFF